MPVDLVIESVPGDLVKLLEARAQRNHRSLEDEVLAILEEAVSLQRRLTPP
jgi:plasmid stability protein